VHHAAYGFEQTLGRVGVALESTGDQTAEVRPFGYGFQRRSDRVRALRRYSVLSHVPRDLSNSTEWRDSQAGAYAE
jgi:hypothetical protein